MGRLLTRHWTLVTLEMRERTTLQQMEDHQEWQRDQDRAPIEEKLWTPQEQQRREEQETKKEQQRTQKMVPRIGEKEKLETILEQLRMHP